MKVVFKWNSSTIANGVMRLLEAVLKYPARMYATFLVMEINITLVTEVTLAS